MTKKITPMMKQYLDMKEAQKDSILMFRLGDFYEMFFEDAEIASKCLNITLTSRNNIPMCGFPYHSIDNYISKLVNSGNKVAICEQLDKTDESTGIVMREITKVITPGVKIDGNLLEGSVNNYLAGISFDKNKIGTAFIDASTGDFFVCEVTEYYEVLELFKQFQPKELIYSEDKQHLIDDILIADGIYLNAYNDSYFDYVTCYNLLKRQFKVSTLDGFGCKDVKTSIQSAGAILKYVLNTQNSEVKHIRNIRNHVRKNYMIIDHTSIKNLEIVQTSYEQSYKGSLIGLLDKCMTSMGSRLIRRWMTHPLLNREDIIDRLDSVSEFISNQIGLNDIRTQLKSVYDIERLNGRLGTLSTNPRDLRALAKSFRCLLNIKISLEKYKAPLLSKIYKNIDPCIDLADLIENAIADEPPVILKEGGIIKRGYNNKLDELVKLSNSGKDWILKYEIEQRKKTGITSLKVKYNKVFGYSIEVTKSNLSMVPDSYIRKQTLANAERYITQELKEHEGKVLTADEKSRQLEYELFTNLRTELSKETKRIGNSADFVSKLDCLQSFAFISNEYRYVKPKITDDTEINIVEGRHPVIERMNLEEGFVPNDIKLDTDTNQLMIITGPNMAGKSTILRQTGILVIMAQIGCYVPAKEAQIGLVDRIFTRVGAGDNISRGQSTFMVEMVETAEILNSASKSSLILMDEIGRGTSTFDGLSIAWAVAEFIHDTVGARTMFATHYHELTELEKTKKSVINYNIAVKEWDDKIIFLRTLKKGGTNRSYGIQVAKLAGLPKEVLERSKEILENLEKTSLDETELPKYARTKLKDKSEIEKPLQMSLFNQSSGYLDELLLNLNLDDISPKQALEHLYKWKEKL